jgi:hypothetical protein
MGAVLALVLAGLVSVCLVVFVRGASLEDPVLDQYRSRSLQDADIILYARLYQQYVDHRSAPAVDAGRAYRVRCDGVYVRDRLFEALDSAYGDRPWRP